MSLTYQRTITVPGTIKDICGATTINTAILVLYNDGLNDKLRNYALLTGLPNYSDTTVTGNPVKVGVTYGAAVTGTAAGNFRTYNIATGAFLFSGSSDALPTNQNSIINTGYDVSSSGEFSYISGSSQNKIISLPSSLVAAEFNYPYLSEITCISNGVIGVRGLIYETNARSDGALDFDPIRTHKLPENLTPSSIFKLDSPDAEDGTGYIANGYLLILCEEGILLVLERRSGRIVQSIPTSNNGSFGNFHYPERYYTVPTSSLFYISDTSFNESDNYLVINEIDVSRTPIKQISQTKIKISRSNLIFGWSRGFVWAADKSSNQIYVFSITQDRVINSTPFSFNVSGNPIASEIFLIDDSISPAELMLKGTSTQKYLPTTQNKSIICVAHRDDGVNEKYDAIRITT